MISSKNTTLRFAKSLNSGDIVKTVVYGGDIAEKVFWDLDGDTAYISSRACYERMLKGDLDARPTGFLINDLVLN